MAKRRPKKCKKKAKRKKAARCRKPTTVEKNYIAHMKAWLAAEGLELAQHESIIAANHTEIEFHRKRIKAQQVLLRLQQQKVTREQRKFAKWKTKEGLSA